MLNATKLTFAAALLFGSCGLAMAQAAGAGTDKTEGSEAGPGRPALLQSPSATSSPQSNAMQAEKANLNAGQQTGTANDSAGIGRTRRPTRQRGAIFPLIRFGARSVRELGADQERN